MNSNSPQKGMIRMFVCNNNNNDNDSLLRSRSRRSCRCCYRRPSSSLWVMMMMMMKVVVVVVVVVTIGLCGGSSITTTTTSTTTVTLLMTSSALLSVFNVVMIDGSSRSSSSGSGSNTTDDADTLYMIGDDVNGMPTTTNANTTNTNTGSTADDVDDDDDDHVIMMEHNNNHHHHYYYHNDNDDADDDDYYYSMEIIVEGTIPPSFQQCRHPRGTPSQDDDDIDDDKCSKTNKDRIHQQQQNILNAIQQRLLLWNNTNNNYTVQCTDASYRFMNAMQLRIVITTTVTNNTTLTATATTDDTRNGKTIRRNDVWSLLLQQQLPHIVGIQQIYWSQSQQQPQQSPPNKAETDPRTTGSTSRNRNGRRRRSTRWRRTVNASTATTSNNEETRHSVHRQVPRLSPQPLPLQTVGVDVAHQMLLLRRGTSRTKSTNDTTSTTTTKQQQQQQPLNDDYEAITGVGIRIAVLDSGIDYTHVTMNGIGTKSGFAQAYGTSIHDDRNTRRDAYFPTLTVIDGYDTLGDIYNNNNNPPTDDSSSSSIYAQPDGDPIDLNGHGTAVAHVIRTVAPSAQLIAVKICSTTTTITQPSICPDFAYIRGIEYLLDRNHDGIVDTDPETIVHVINLSIGRMYMSSYYNIMSKITETLINTHNIIVVVSAGNYGNVPFILGDVAGTPNAITVGATSTTVVQPQSDHNGDTISVPRIMAPYSSRGPAASVRNQIKPDIVGPGGPYSLAYASTGDQYRTFEGTSFATPYITGGVALLKQKCLDCSPLAIKSLLMNHAVHTILRPPITSTPTTTTSTAKNGQYDRSYTSNANNTISSYNNDDPVVEWAPVTLQGSGEMQIHKSLLATYWVYCVEDGNPSISFGSVDVAATPTIQLHRTLRITKLSNTANETVYFRHELRSLIHRKAISIQFIPESIVLDGECHQEYTVMVTFVIHTQYAPSNHMVAGGWAGTNPNNLDFNELDGWIIVSSSSGGEEEDDDDDDDDNKNNVGLPFHMIVRKAANVTMGSLATISDEIFNSLPTNITVNMENNGAEVAQIDSYQLIYVSPDQPEGEFGSYRPPADLQYVGYRTISSRNNYKNSVDDCSTMIEFAIHTWERQQSLSYTHFNLWIDFDHDTIAEHTIYNSAYRLGSTHSEMRRIDLRTNREYCIGYTPDHATNSANTVLRFCSDDIGINTKTFNGTASSTVTISVAISSYSFPNDEVSDIMEYRNISIPHIGLEASSYDIEPGAVLQNIHVSGTGTAPPVTTTTTTTTTTRESSSQQRPMGLLLLTNSFRTWISTGAATHDSEAIAIGRSDIILPNKITSNDEQFSVPVPPSHHTQQRVGPSCCTWDSMVYNTNHTSSPPPSPCPPTDRRFLRSEPSIQENDASNAPPQLKSSLRTMTSDRSQNPRRRPKTATTASTTDTIRNNHQLLFVPQYYHRHRILQQQQQQQQQQHPPLLLEEICPEYTIPRTSSGRIQQQT